MTKTLKKLKFMLSLINYNPRRGLLMLIVLFYIFSRYRLLRGFSVLVDGGGYE